MQEERRIFGSRKIHISPLTPFDVVRSTLFGEQGRSDRAHALDRLGASRSFKASVAEASRGGMSPRGKSCAWVMTQGIRVIGLVSARQRSGPQSWEIRHLFLKPDAEGALPDLLENVSRWVASRGGEKVFLRLLREDPLVDIAKQSGFFPRIPEVLYTSTPSLLKAAAQPLSENGEARFRPRSRTDYHHIFRVYIASTPQEVRYAIGMTFDQWFASREPSWGRQREYVLQNEAGIKAWLAVAKRGGRGRLSAMAHPDHEQALPDMLRLGLQHMGQARVIYCMVPEYQVALQRVLAEAGFQAVSDYVTLVKSMAVAARKDVRATVAAPSI